MVDTMNFGAKRVIISGTPGTGKTTTANLLGEETGLKVFNIDTKYIRDLEADLEKDKEKDSINVNLRKLRERLIELEGIIESHLLCEISLPDSIVIVLRCKPEKLEKRLKKRNYDKGKIKENLEAEALDYCTQRSSENYGELYEVDTTDKKTSEVVEECISILKGRRKGDGNIDFSDYLFSSL